MYNTNNILSVFIKLNFVLLKDLYNLNKKKQRIIKQ